LLAFLILTTGAYQNYDFLMISTYIIIEKFQLQHTPSILKLLSSLTFLVVFDPSSYSKY
jgi:hypothetical protein